MSAAAPARLRVEEDQTDPTRVVIGVDDLRDLMQSVDETTRTLQETHVALQQQVVRLQGELAEANVQLRRSRSLAALGEMAAGIAHEIRNPLGSIQLYAQLLAEDLVERPETAELCDKINRAVSGLDAIVRDVLIFFLADTSVSAVEIGVRELVARGIETCDALIDEGGVRVDIDVHPDLRVCVDASLMTSALGNVIRNAAEAMREGGAAPMLAIEADRGLTRCPDGRRADRIRIAVRDTGDGIPREVLDRIFNPFFTTRASGTGLGLAIVHRIVDAHGGHLQVDSTPGRGTTVTLFLPNRPPADAAAET